jgi:hypothetical protein
LNKSEEAFQPLLRINFFIDIYKDELTMMKFGMCTCCHDMYELPEGMVEGRLYQCLKCHNLYELKIIQMEEFVFKCLKSCNPTL